MKTREDDWRILWIRRGWMGGEPLDGAGRRGFRIRRTDRFVEGEIVRVRSTADEVRAEVVASRIDPAYSPGPRPRLEEYVLEENDPALGPYFVFEQPLEEWSQYRWYSGMPSFPVDETKRQRTRCREWMERHPLFLEPRVRMAELEWFRGRFDRSRKYLESAWKTAMMAFPRGFSGTIDYRNGPNIILFVLAETYARALAGTGRESEAIEILRFLLARDRPGTWDGDGMLLPLLLRAGHLDELAEELTAADDLGADEYLRALLLLDEGDRAGAAKAVCRGAAANPLVLRALFAVAPDTVPFRERRYGLAWSAALHAGLTAREWRKRNALLFLTELLAIPAFYRALETAVALAKEEDRKLEGPPARREIRACFSRCVREAAVRPFVRA